MPVTSTTTDPEALTMTVVAEFAAPVQRVWDAYADPRQIERFWGPPEYPAQFTRHDFAVGGKSAYAMTGPEGDRHEGYWEWLTVEPLERFEVIDGFANPDGTPNSELPAMRMVIGFDEIADDRGTRVTMTSYFSSLEALEQLLEMGAEEGTVTAVNQMDAVLADLREFASDIPTHSQLLSDTQVRISRVLNGSVEQIWRAHNDAGLMQQWLLGPEGWSMPVCEIAANVGDSYRYEWAPEGGGEGGFGFVGELLESQAPYRAVTTERMIGMPGDGTLNELTLTPIADGTLLTLVITYPTMELRDTILGTGMTDGMEVSYQRLEALAG